MKRSQVSRRLRALVPLLTVGVILVLQAAPGGIAQEGPWFTVRKYCLLVLLGITWALIAFCVLSGAGICVQLARRIRGTEADESVSDALDVPPAGNIKSS